MALKYFAEQNCDLVVWETGLGGRLDATNIVLPLASVITNVQLDHQQHLGQTIPEIAVEKAGIIKPQTPIITAAEEPALAIIKRIANERRAPLTVIGPAEAAALASLEIALAGAHQRLNAALALATVRVLSGALDVSDAAISTGLKEAHWPGRLQEVRRPNGQIVLLDGAHNPAGAETLAATLRERQTRSLSLILGAIADKDYSAICGILAPSRQQFLSPRFPAGAPPIRPFSSKPAAPPILA